MIKKYLKSEKGITLISLTVYIIVLSLVVGIMGTISNFFYGNLNIVKDTAKYSSEFDKFNSSIIADVKLNKHVQVDSENKTIIFGDGTTYKYNPMDEGIYRGKNKIATHVTYFEASSKTIIVNDVNKEILTINVIIGTSDKKLIDKQIDYTLKYW